MCIHMFVCMYACVCVCVCVCYSVCVCKCWCKPNFCVFVCRNYTPHMSVYVCGYVRVIVGAFCVDMQGSFWAMVHKFIYYIYIHVCMYAHKRISRASI